MSAPVTPVKDSAQQSQPNEMAQALLCLQHVVEQCQEIVFITDHAGIITRVNPAFEEITGYSSLEAVGKDLSCITAGGAQSEAYRRIWEHIFVGKVFRGPLVFESQAGERCQLEITLTPLRDKSGLITSLVGTGRETSQPSSRCLPERRVSGTKPQTAHELNNLLTIMSANADLALASLMPNHPAWRNLQDIKTAVRRASELGRQLRNAESEKLELPAFEFVVQKTCNELPAVSGGNSNAALPERQPPFSHPAEARPPVPTLLIVDDEALIRESTAEFLCKSGYRVLAAASAEEAMEAVKSHPTGIQLMIADLVLPQMSGAQLASALASTQPGMKVLLVSGYAETALLPNQPPDMTRHFLQKPFSLHALAIKVQEILGPGQRARGAAGAAG